MASVVITQQTVNAAKAAARPGVTQTEITDARAEGLRLRIGARGVRWQLRFKIGGKGNRLDLGGIEDWSIAEARDLAAEAQRIIRAGVRRPDEAWLQEQRIRLGKIEAPTRPQEDKRLTMLWAWDTALDEYLKHAQDTLAEATSTSYRRALRAPDMDRFKGRPVASITLEEMAVAIADLHKRAQGQAHHLASYVRPMWRYLERPEIRGKSGVERRAMRDLTAPPKSRRKERADDVRGEYVPSMLELGRIVAICRSGAVDPFVAAGIELLVFAAQRRRQTVLALKRKISPRADGAEALWSIPSAHRKTAARRGDTSDHVVPLAAPAYAAVKRALVAGEDHKEYEIYRSLRVFPQLRPQKAGGSVDHLHPDTLSHTLSYFPGVRATPHDLRRSFGTLGERELGIPRMDTKAILDHLEGERSGDVTATSYALHDGSHRKWPVMRRWADYVDQHVPLAIAADPKLLDLVWLKAQIKQAQDIAKDKTRKAGLSLERPDGYKRSVQVDACAAGGGSPCTHALRLRSRRPFTLC